MLHKLASRIKSHTERCVPQWVKDEAEKVAAAETALQIRTQAHKHNLQNHLVRLPTELILEITDRLPRDSIMALSLTCTHFYNAIAYPILAKSPSKENSFHILAPLEKALGFWQRKLLCGGCFIAHKDKDFRHGQEALDAVERRCIPTQEMLWVHPDLVVSFSTLEMIGRQLRDAGISFSSPEPKRCTIHHVQHHGKDMVVLDHAIDLMHFPLSKFPTLGDVSTVLQQFNAFVCPHWTTGDPLLVDIYRQSILMYMPTVILGRGHRCCDPGCKTYVFFQIRAHRDGIFIGEKLVMHIRRLVNIHNGPERRSWLHQSIITTDKDKFREAWLASWRWKAADEELSKLHFKLNFLGHLSNADIVAIRQRASELQCSHDMVAPREDLRSFYKPFVPTTQFIASYVRKQNQKALKIRSLLGDPLYSHLFA
ncbi:hypothetical protein FQN54_002882 [Arachnomyces sp. PD_36]|nr:hypothetical protein FQN54_002882 [Arachnomyces sp. PD_36]